MKQLLRYTSTLLRTALLLGAMILVNTQQTQAQTLEQWAEMPDAFETMDPASIIGDGNYYYIQFYNANHTQCSYLTDRGLNMRAWAKDFLPYAYNRLWALESAGDGDDTHFKLKSKIGNYLGYAKFEAQNSRYGSINNSENAVTFMFRQNGDGYDISDVTNNGLLARYEGSEWTDFPYQDDRQSHKNNARLRFAKLKSTAAFIIYYRGEHTDGNDNNSPGETTTRHYLTYSGTGNESPARDDYYRDSEVSTRRSIIPSDKPLCTLPTLAAYHQDGLWTLEGTGVDGQFYIKKYGSTDEYLNLAYVQGGDIFKCGVLGVKDNLNGNYTLVDRDANRYTLVQNVKYNETALASSMFYNWTGYGANPTQGSQATVDFNTNHSITADEIASGYTLVGTGWVDHQIYADLTNYSKMVIRGDQNMQLRVLMNRQESNSGYYVERDVSIGSDGTAVVDLTGCTVGQGTVKMTYINGNDADKSTSYGEIAAGNAAYCGYNRILNGSVELRNKDWGVNNVAYLQVDASAINGTIKKVTLIGDFQQIAARPMEYGVGYNNSDWTSTMTWETADRSITTLGGTQTVEKATADKTLSFDITGAFSDGKVKTIMVYNLAAGAGYIKNPKVYVEYEPNDASTRYVHLNAIKTGWSSPTGTVTSIGLMSENTGDTYYLHHAKGDGWQLMEWTGTDNDYFNAGFYPVEVPVPNKDDYFQVLVKWSVGGEDRMINHNGGFTTPFPTNEADYDLWQLEMIDDYQHFRLKAPDGRYLKPNGTGMTDPNDPTGAEINTNEKFWTDFSLTWFYVDPNAVAKEILVDYMVTHKKSYLQQYAQAGLDKQGLATNKDSDWKNEDGTQKTNHFEITHYVKKGNTITVEFPTVLNRNNDHIYYQRFYNYDEADGSMDLENLKAHVSLDTRDDGDVQYFLYKNGMVTGQKLDWTSIEDGGYARNVQRRFNFTNSDGNAFTVAADVSRYSDIRYWNTTTHLEGDLEEPSLTMRYIYYMKDAKEMATSLSSYTEQPGVPDRTVWKETGDDVCVDDSKWMETKEIHFPATPLPYENEKWAGYRGEFIGLRHVFSDYWVFDGAGTGDENLVSAKNDDNGGKIEVRIYDPNNTGIRLGGWNPNINLKETTEGDDAYYQGFYFYDKVARNQKTQYGNSRFIVFRYPKDGSGNATTVTVEEGKEKKAYLHVYLNNNGTRYQLAQFTVIFDENSDTRPWTSVNESAKVKSTDRDPNNLRERAGKPIAKITFDYPTGETYHYPASTAEGPLTRHNGGDDQYGTIANSSPIPLKFDNTNYAFDGDGCNWGSYALVTTKNTQWGNGKTAQPANADKTEHVVGYGIDPDAGLQSAFLYIDASEQPGDICSADFQGEFCAGDKLMCSGWISGSNRYSDNGEYRCPGSITLTVKGERTEGGVKVKDEIYRFCPGQCYELNDGTGVDGSTDGTNVVWQQFYFEFSIDRKYERQYVEVNNNCVSSNGGDFMLDNIEIYAIVPEVDPKMNTPICVHKSSSEMQLLKLDVGFDKLMLASGVTEATSEADTHDYNFGLVFLKKDVFLQTFKTALSTHNSINLTLEEVEANVDAGVYGDLTTYGAAYQEAFDAALLGNKTIWDSNSPTTNEGAGVLNFHWSNDFSKMEAYSFAKAVNRQKTIFGYTDSETGERFLVMNGNYPKLDWEANTDYYLIPYNAGITDIDRLYLDFNICSECSKEKVFQILPSIQILSMEASDVTEDLVVCEGKIPTLLTNLRGYNINGESVPMKNLNFDWWLGSETVLATLDNYHSQTNGSGVRLDEALYIFRLYYPDVTSLDGVVPRSKTNTKSQDLHTDDPELTQAMIDYLKSLVNAGQLVLHQKSISIPAEKVSDADPYFYLVACPIHDEAFDQALNYETDPANKYVAYFCDEPQGVRIKVGEKAPTLKCGFVPGENGFTNYDYSTVDDAVLSIRLAKKAQFEEVQHGNTTDSPATTYNTSASSEKHFLWLPIRNAEVETTGSTGVIRKSDDYDVYLASTDDPTWDQEIYKKMNQYDTDGNLIGSLPVVGKIVQLTAVNTKGNSSVSQTSNRLCIYFTSNFEVREGYSYTLSLPFKEDGDGNACDGNILLNLKIVPDYEVWTGGAGNTDWNNDQNWRRADGNTTSTSGVNNNELYVTNSLPNTSPLYQYITNASNYRTDKDRVFRKGFAPLYCTHVLMKSDEWGNAPVLYDALDGAGSLSASPFPNLRDTSTPILKFDMQARKFDLWSETYGSASDKGRAGDLIAEMYQINTCDEIVFQPAAELRNAHLLNYNNAWVEYQLDMARWYLLGSPLQGTIAGEWYAPTGTAQQKTTYYENVTFGEGYDRYSPAIYQRSWDKAKAVLYEVGANYSTSDDSQDNLGTSDEGQWGTDDNTQAVVWQAQGGGTADEYLDRLGYKPLGGKKANVAIKGVWSNTYNDATVDYTKGGFSVMVLNNLKGGSNTNPAIIRLPKEDTMYDYYQYSQTGDNDGGTDTDLSDIQTAENLKRARNRGRLKTDLLLPTSTQKTESTASRYGDRRTYTRVPIKEADLKTMINSIRTHQETASAGISNMGYYLVENPFPCGMDMDQFFTTNTGLEKKYWLLTATGQHLVQKAADGDWITQTGEPVAFTTANAVVAPGQGFFVQATTAGEATTITFNKDMQAQSRYGVKSDDGTDYIIVVGTKQVMETITQTADDGTEVQVTVPKTDGEGNFVTDDITEDVTVYNYVQTTDSDKKYILKARTCGEESLAGLVITAQRGDMQSSALVMQREEASNDFLPEEDTETFINSDLEHVPTVYTLCGRLATTINSIHDFRSLPIGVESSSDAPCTLTFRGVEMLGDSIAFYDAVEQELTPLESGMSFKVSGQTQNRYYLVRSLIQEEAAAETHLQIFTEGLTAKVIASTDEPIVSVRCFDTAGRLIHTAEPQTREYSFVLPRKGIYIIDAQTEDDRKSVKVMAR